MSANATVGIGGLRAQRRALGLSQQSLAERVRCSVSMVRLLESGYSPDDSAVLQRIVLVLNGRSPVGEPGSDETISGAMVAGNVPSD